MGLLVLGMQETQQLLTEVREGVFEESGWSSLTD